LPVPQVGFGKLGFDLVFPLKYTQKLINSSLQGQSYVIQFILPDILHKKASLLTVYS